MVLFMSICSLRECTSNPKESQYRILVVITVPHPRLVKFQNNVRGVDHFVLGTNCQKISTVWKKYGINQRQKWPA